MQVVFCLRLREKGDGGLCRVREKRLRLSGRKLQVVGVAQWRSPSDSCSPVRNQGETLRGQDAKCFGTRLPGDRPMNTGREWA